MRPTPEGCLIYDLGSSLGTKVDDQALAGNPLSSGDVIKLGLAELEFVQEGPT